MEVESAILPPDIRLDYAIRRYTFRLSKLSENHPVRAKYTKISVPNLSFISNSSESNLASFTILDT